MSLWPSPNLTVKHCVDESCICVLDEALGIARLDYCNSVLSDRPSCTLQALSSVLHTAANKGAQYTQHIGLRIELVHCNNYTGFIRFAHQAAGSKLWIRAILCCLHIWLTDWCAAGGHVSDWKFIDRLISWYSCCQWQGTAVTNGKGIWSPNQTLLLCSAIPQVLINILVLIVYLTCPWSAFVSPSYEWSHM